MLSQKLKGKRRKEVRGKKQRDGGSWMGGKNRYGVKVIYTGLCKRLNRLGLLLWCRLQVGISWGPSCSTFNSVPCWCTQESSEEWPMSLGPCTHMGDSEEALGSWFQTSPVPAILTIWTVNQRMGARSLCFSL